jgi:predicted dehydrogenase
MIKAGVAGLGRWGQNLVRSVQGKSDSISFTAGMVRHPDKVADFAAEQGLELFDSYDAMLASADIDAVVLATPHSLHAEQMLAAAAAGKHIFSEKPFTLNKADAERVIASANEAGVQIAVGHCRRFHPAIAELRSRLADGALGTVLHVEASESVPAGLMLPPGDWHLSREEWPAAGMTPLGIHLIDGMIDLFGTVTSVYCNSVNRGEPESIRFDPYDMESDALTAELEAFADAVEGRAPYPIPLDQIIHAVAVLEAIITSADTGAPVTVG